MAKNGKRVSIKLECEEGSGYFYTTTTNQQNNAAKSSSKKKRFLKYNPKLKRRSWFKETKLKS